MSFLTGEPLHLALVLRIDQMGQSWKQEEQVGCHGSMPGEYDAGLKVARSGQVLDLLQRQQGLLRKCM